MKKILTFFLLAFVFGTIEAQIGIGTTNPEPSASLDITATNSGLLIPRLDLWDVYDGTTPIASPAISLLVYNTNPFVVGGEGAGYYYWNGSQYVKLMVASDDKWTRTIFGQLHPTNLFENVGIGTNNPVTTLHVRSSNSNPMIIDGGDNLFISFAENGNYRGYFGSYSGNSNDIELGTYAGNLGAVHLTTNNSPKLTVLNGGNVGIGTTTPAQRLDVSGKIRINDGTQAAGRILASDANGVGTWVNTSAITPAVIGVFAGAGASFGNGTPVGVQSAMNYCNVYIDLPPGKWIVFGTYLLAGATTLTTGQSIFVRTTLSTSNTVVVNTDIIAGGLVSGILAGPSDFGLANGQTVINNTSGAVKRYYLWANIQKYGTTPTNYNMAGIGSNFWSENQLSAIPTN